jgi:hypothetical protein
VPPYSFVLGDANTFVRYNNGAAGTFLVPANAAVAFPIGTVIVMDQKGAGQLTLGPTGAASIDNATPGLKTRAQFSSMAITKLATDEWELTGDSAP